MSDVRDKLYCVHLLDVWKRDYPLPDGVWIVFVGFQHFDDKKLLGRTRMHSEGGLCEIALSDRLDKDWKINAVLWHEFCHCCLPIGESHGRKFWRMMFRKPLLALADLIL